MPGILSKLTWKFWALLIVVGLIASTGYFAVQKFTETISENQELKVANATLEAEKKALADAQRAISEAVTVNDTNTRTIVERTHSIEEKIREVPVTTKCVEAPAIGVVLDDYRRRMRDEADATRPN